MRLKPFRTQCPPRHYAVWSYFSFNLSLCDCRFRVFGAAGKPRIGRFFMTIFVILFFACIITPSLTLSQRRNNKELAAHELDGRRLVIRKRCPPPKCCNVVEHVSRTRGGTTRELGRALRSSIERGRSLHEATMKMTSNEALAGLADRSFAERMLEEKAKQDLAVAEQKQAKAEKELEHLKQADKQDEERAREFEEHRIHEEEEEVKKQKHAVESLAVEEQKIADALEEELAALEAEVGATEADAKAADAKLDAMFAEAVGEESPEAAARLAEEAEAKAEEEKAEHERKEATRVAEIAKHITEETTDKLQQIADATESEEVPETVASMGELQTEVLSDMQESEKEEQQALADEEAEKAEQEGKEDSEQPKTEAEPDADADEGEKIGSIEETKDLLFLLRHLPPPKSHKAANNSKEQTTEEEQEEEALADLQPLDFPVAAVEQTAAPEPLEAEPQLDEGEEELPELWFGNKGPEEEKLQAEEHNDKEKKWWQYMLS